MSKGKSSKTVLLAHSLAKLDLYSQYLEIYFAVLGNIQYIDHINIFDLFCGEGLYLDNNEGSPLAALEKANNFFNRPQKFVPYIHLYFNDIGRSEIIKTITKICRLKSIIKERPYNKNIFINYSELEFAEALNKSLVIALEKNRSRSLFFIDPYGYKTITPPAITAILSNYKSELLLFLPISHMYRFACPAQEIDNEAYEPLKKFILELFSGEHQCFSSSLQFINALKDQFYDYIKLPNLFIDTFSLQRNKSNYYCLFFFTRNEVGFEKMLEAKWKIDTETGKGFKLGKQYSLFAPSAFSPYPDILKRLLTNKGEVTNIDLYYFGLYQGYLPKHTIQSLNHLTASGLPLERYSLDGQPANGYYISNKNRSEKFERKIGIRLPNHERYQN